MRVRFHGEHLYPADVVSPFDATEPLSPHHPSFDGSSATPRCNFGGVDVPASAVGVAGAELSSELVCLSPPLPSETAHRRASLDQPL